MWFLTHLSYHLERIFWYLLIFLEMAFWNFWNECTIQSQWSVNDSISCKNKSWQVLFISVFQFTTVTLPCPPTPSRVWLLKVFMDIRLLPWKMGYQLFVRGCSLIHLLHLAVHLNKQNRQTNHYCHCSKTIAQWPKGGYN